MPRSFAEDRADATSQDALDLSELIRVLNSCSRRAFSLSIRDKLPADEKSMSLCWAEASGAFKAQGVDAGLTRDQKNLVVRLALSDRKAQIEQAKYLAQRFKELAQSCGRKIERDQRIIAELSLTAEDANPFERRADILVKLGELGQGKKSKSKAEAIAKAMMGTQSTKERIARLIRKSEESAKQAEAGFVSRAFGTQKLAVKISMLSNAVHALDARVTELRASSKNIPRSKGIGSRAGRKAKAARSKACRGLVGLRKASTETQSELAQAKKLWSSARDGDFLFSGDKGASSANRFVKYEIAKGEDGNPDKHFIHVRLLESQYERRLQAEAAKLGLTLSEFKAGKLKGKLEIQERAKYARLDLSFGEELAGEEALLLAMESRAGSKKGKPKFEDASKYSQIQRIKKLMQALSPLGFEELDRISLEKIERRKSWKARLEKDREEFEANHPGKAFPKGMLDPAEIQIPAFIKAQEKFKGHVKPARQALSWRIRVGEGEIFARAEWDEAASGLKTYREGGCLGIDINAWGIAWAVCTRRGNIELNKGAKAKNVGEVPIDWQRASSAKCLHACRIAAHQIVNMALARGIPLALEALSFEFKKANLRYEEGKRAKALSGFAYAKLIQAIVACSEKSGVEVIWVDPAYTSVSGFAKYGFNLGLDADKSAAFAIARKAMLSKKESELSKRTMLGDWKAVAIKPEKLEGKRDASGKLHAKAQEAKAKLNDLKVKKSKEVKAVEVESLPTASGPAPGADAGSARRSMGPASEPKDGNPWRAVGRALGKSRTSWGEILGKAAKAAWTQGRGTGANLAQSGMAKEPGAAKAPAGGPPPPRSSPAFESPKISTR